MRALNVQEIELLREHNILNRKVIFSDEDLNDLLAGNPTFKVFDRATKVIEEMKLQGKQFVTREQVDRLVKQIMSILNQHREDMNKIEAEVNALSDKITFLTQTLIRNGVITEEQFTHTAHSVIAENWKDVCLFCEKKDADVCIEVGQTVTIARAIFPDLTGEVAQKIVKCEGFTLIPEGK